MLKHVLQFFGFFGFLDFLDFLDGGLPNRGAGGGGPTLGKNSQIIPYLSSDGLPKRYQICVHEPLYPSCIANLDHEHVFGEN